VTPAARGRRKTLLTRRIIERLNAEPGQGPLSEGELALSGRRPRGRG
jgi:hypothetical protein